MFPHRTISAQRGFQPARNNITGCVKRFRRRCHYRRRRNYVRGFPPEQGRNPSGHPVIRPARRIAIHRHPMHHETGGARGALLSVNRYWRCKRNPKRKETQNHQAHTKHAERRTQTVRGSYQLGRAPACSEPPLRAMPRTAGCGARPADIKHIKQ